MSYFAMLCIISISSAIPFQVSLAPDQLIPLTYTHEPLIVSVSGPPNTPFDIIITITKPDGETITQIRPDKPATYLNGKYWITVSNLPNIRGFFIANISIKYRNEVQQWEIPFCRMDRNTDKACGLPFVIHNPDETGLYLAQILGIKEISFDSNLPNLNDLVKKAISLGERVTIVFNVDKHSSPVDIFEDLINKLGGLVSTWEIAGNYNPNQLRNFYERIRKAKGIGALRPSFPKIESLPMILPSIQEEIINEISWSGPNITIEDLKQLKDTLILHRGEGIPFSVHFNIENFSQNPIEQIQQIWMGKCAGAHTLTLPYTALIQDGKVSQLTALLCGTTRVWTDGIEPLGWYKYSGTTKAFVFQSLSHWIMVFWGTEPITLSGEGLATTQFFDSYGNPSTLPQVNDNSLSLDEKPCPQYLLGNAYEVLYITAVNELKTIAKELNFDEFPTFKNPGITEAIKIIAQDPKNSQNRVHVLNLFRELPRLEAQKADTYDVQAQKRLIIAKLSNFLRRVCITEQYRGEPFREPLLDIIARCEEHLTEYLTGSSSSSEKDYRANWILEEVHRLIDHAGKVTSNGKRIEAVGLAYLAESRAQSLDALKQNPLTRPDTDKFTTPSTTIIAKKEEKITAPSTVTATSQTTVNQEPTKVPQENKPETETTAPLEHTVKRGETISSICKLYGITEEEFCSWNGIRKGAKLKTGKVYKIQTVRTQKPTEIKPPEPSTPTPKWEGTEYIVQAGDYPGLIAKKLGVTTAELLKTNDLTEKSKLKIGQKLKVPGAKTQKEESTKTPSSEKEPTTEKVSETTETTTPTTQTEIGETPSEKEIRTYKLNPGDTPAIVAKKFNISVQLLMQYNDIKDPTKLRAGQELKIPTSKSEKTPIKPAEAPKQKEDKPKEPPTEKEIPSEPTIHTVAKGDNPYTISKKYDVPLEALLEANQLTPKSTLHIGQKLIIPSKKTEQ